MASPSDPIITPYDFITFWYVFGELMAFLMYPGTLNDGTLNDGTLNDMFEYIA